MQKIQSTATAKKSYYEYQENVGGKCKQYNVEDISTWRYVVMDRGSVTGVMKRSQAVIGYSA
jgi:hypothetical protein